MAGLEHDTIDGFQSSLAVARPACAMHAAKMILPSSSVLPHILDYFVTTAVEDCYCFGLGY
eukprot:scaffold29273_cov250-Skeletonema_marinoi.AAC.1